MLANFQREYNMNRVFLSTTGLWPFQSKHVRNSLRTFCLLLEISYYPFEILLLYDHWGDPGMVFEALYQFILLTAFIVRALHDIWNRDKLQRLYTAIDEHWDIFTNDTEVCVLKNYSSLSRKFTKYYATIIYLMCSVSLTVPLTPLLLDIVIPLNESRPRFFLMEVEFRVDKKDYFVPIFCYTTTVIMVGMTIMVGVDAMHVICTAHACSLFAAISKQVKNIFSKVNNGKIGECGYRANMELDSSSEEIIYREYIICLKKHQLAIEFVKTLELSYQELSLLLLLLIIATFSLVGVRIIHVLHQLKELMKFAFIIVGVLVTLMIVCYSSQRLMDESQNIFYQAYAAEWYHFSPRLKSLLMITLYRTNTPCVLKAGNVIPLSIATYTAVIRVAISYFTAFLSLQE
ncbi:odorant receptor Or2-like isoform X1 [Temnothorax longispinosus]|uniref:odorant receptor Or2-like isoform X1 n=2 Tax=Temnothorax longispinosus TaxID=300112 RepID=UPI003A993830